MPDTPISSASRSTDRPAVEPALSGRTHYRRPNEDATLGSQHRLFG
jgi:hypothetical protein